MEHKDTPELEAQEIPLEEVPVLPESAPAEETGFVDYFADILPDQPVEEPTAEPQQAPVTGDTEVLSGIQSAVAEILAEETSSEIPPMEEETDVKQEEQPEQPGEETPVCTKICVHNAPQTERLCYNTVR